MALARVEGLTFSYPDAERAALADVLAPGRAGRDRCAPRPVGVREIDAPAGTGRPRSALSRRPLRGPRRGRRTRHPPLQPGRSRGRGRLPVPGPRGPDRLRPRRERGRVRAREPRRAPGGDLAPRPRRARQCRHRAASRAAHRDALGRRAPACLSRGRSCGRPLAAAPGRADLAARPRRSRGDSRPGVRAGLGGRRLGAAPDTAAGALRPRALRRGRTSHARRAPRRGAGPARSGVPAPAGQDLQEPRGRGRESRQGRERELLVWLRAARSTAHRSELRRGEIVALTGPQRRRQDDAREDRRRAPRARGGERSSVTGRVCYLSQDPGRYLVTERAEREASLAVGGDLARAREALARVGLAGLERRHPRDLSSGERERLALASVLVAEPDVLVLDEPTRGVDPPRKSELAEILRRESANRATLIVTHDLVFAGDVADRVVHLEARELARA